MQLHPGHCVAIFGGAVAGAEAAGLLSQQGIYTVIFEQNALPYGKIEDGLPKWHVKLRDKEEQKIDEKLRNPYVQFVPNTKLGDDIDFETIIKKWGFSAVLLAIGAWRDRPLPVEGIDAYVGKGLYYQNPFIYWFNHYHEPNFSGETFEVHDGTVVIGGGLASIDVIKALMIITVGRALRERGHKVDFFELEKRGPARILDELHLTMDDLGLKGCSLYYRRTAINMPLTPIPEDADERRLQKAYEVRERMMKKLQDEFLFQFHECHSPVDKILEGERLAGLVFKKMKSWMGGPGPFRVHLSKCAHHWLFHRLAAYRNWCPAFPSKATSLTSPTNRQAKSRATRMCSRSATPLPAAATSKTRGSTAAWLASTCSRIF